MSAAVRFSAQTALPEVYDLAFQPMSVLRRAALEHRLAVRLGAWGRMHRLHRVLLRLTVYNLRHGRCFDHFDRTVEEGRVGPRVCPGCDEEIAAECMDRVCPSCQHQVMLAQCTCVYCNEPIPAGTENGSGTCSIECALDALESGL